MLRNSVNERNTQQQENIQTKVQNIKFGVSSGYTDALQEI